MIMKKIKTSWVKGICFTLLFIMCLASTKLVQAKSYSISYEETVKNNRSNLTVFYTGKEKIKKVEYKAGKITSTSNAKWKNAKNYTKKFSVYKEGGKWKCGSNEYITFRKKGYITFRFTTTKNHKYIKTIAFNPKPKYIQGYCTLTGTIKKVSWKHHNGSGEILSTYVLDLSSPKNNKVEDNWDSGTLIYCRQKSLQLTVIDHPSIKRAKYVGKKVKVYGKLWAGAGTGYYIINVSFDVRSIRKQ